MTTTLLLMTCAAMGLVVGSFLTAVVDRVPRGQSLMTPASACRSCGHRLGMLDLVPVASWLALRGRCRHCGDEIGRQPLLVEIVTVLLFVGVGLRYGADAVTLALCAFVAALVALSWIDVRHQRLPREISYTAFILTSILLVIAALVNDEPERIWQAALGAALATAIMGAIYMAARGDMGSGDVRLAPLLGVNLGFVHLGIVPIGLLTGFVFGAVAGVGLMAAGRAGRRTPLPLGPFLAAGAIVALFAGEWFVDVLWQ